MLEEEYKILRDIENNQSQKVVHKYHEDICSILMKTKPLDQHVFFGQGKPMDANIKRAKVDIIGAKHESISPIEKVNKGILAYCLQDNNKAIELLSSALFDGADSIFAKLILNKIYLDSGKGSFVNFSDFEVSQFPFLNFMIGLSSILEGDFKGYEESIKCLIEHTSDSNLSFLLSNLLNVSEKIATYSPTKDAFQQETKNTYIAAIGYRFSGGSALVDFLKGHSDVSAPFHEYKATAALMPILADKTLDLNKKIVRIIIWLDKYLLGVMLPLHYYDVMPYGLIQKDKSDCSYNLRINLICGYIERNYFNFSLPMFFESIWEGYSQEKSALLLPKIFKLGNFQGVDILPKLTTILIHRDPRDQYVDRVNNGWMELNSHKKFIQQYEHYIQQTNKYLDMYKGFSLNQYRFEDLVTKEATRNEILELCELDKSRIGNEFDFDKSKKNIGIWEDYKNQKEIDSIAKHFKLK